MRAVPTQTSPFSIACVKFELSLLLWNGVKLALFYAAILILVLIPNGNERPKIDSW